MMSLNAFILCITVVAALWVSGNCSICDEPKQPGSCRARIPRFYFNRFSGRCEIFYWGGCRPNGNNFATEQACNAACVVPQLNACDQPKRVGPCKALKPRYFFNRINGQCERFYWGGCRANGNNFATEQECMTACAAVPVNPCDEPKSVGPCTGRIPSYYFDRISGRCKVFYWGGCLPNGNNFRTYQECSRTCDSFSY